VEWDRMDGGRGKNERGGGNVHFQGRGKKFQPQTWLKRGRSVTYEKKTNK